MAHHTQGLDEYTDPAHLLTTLSSPLIGWPLSAHLIKKEIHIFTVETEEINVSSSHISLCINFIYTAYNIKMLQSLQSYGEHSSASVALLHASSESSCTSPGIISLTKGWSSDTHAQL
ncbi:Hypothetical predicted protein [Xyrichtys novacula]|uniref:Uncharacterized protein n=1 Tax=Xyrichtys novacula TaxID=13765 RepID=A0AAV1H766_XYRNO|nr:Hypothetical predicted protein [Xyrichtys novacula]